VKGIKYDLKTISSSGWSPTLIPDELMIDTFFQKEKAEIEKIESDLSEQENLLSEAIEAVEYETVEDETATTKTIKDYLAAEIKDLEDSEKESAARERKILVRQLSEIKNRESRISKLKKALKEKEEELKHKLDVKRYGLEGSRYRLELLKKQAQRQIEQLESVTESDAKEERKRTTKLNGLKKYIAVLDKKIDGLEELLVSIVGMVTDEESKELILLKHFGHINDELSRYLNQEKRALIAVFENLWDKYAISAQSWKKGEARQ